MSRGNDQADCNESPNGLRVRYRDARASTWSSPAAGRCPDVDTDGIHGHLFDRPEEGNAADLSSGSSGSDHVAFS